MTDQGRLPLCRAWHAWFSEKYYSLHIFLAAENASANEISSSIILCRGRLCVLFSFICLSKNIRSYSIGSSDQKFAQHRPGIPFANLFYKSKQEAAIRYLDQEAV